MCEIPPLVSAKLLEIAEHVLWQYEHPEAGGGFKIPTYIAMDCQAVFTYVARESIQPVVLLRKTEEAPPCAG